MKNNCGAAGAAQAKTGKQATPLCRSAGMSSTLGAISSKTRSRHHSSARPYHYQGISGYGSNENIKGYGS